MAIGEHQHTSGGSRDVNGFTMVMCYDCGVAAHEIDQPTAEANLARAKCSKDCENCNNLRESNERAPTVPEGGRCNDLLHTCPRCGNRWSQSNTHFHMWDSVTNDQQWELLKRPPQRPHSFFEEDDGFFS